MAYVISFGMAASTSNKGYPVLEAVDTLCVRSVIGRVVIPPPPKRVPKVTKQSGNQWFFCKCLKAFGSEEALIDHQKTHDETSSSETGSESGCVIENQQEAFEEDTASVEDHSTVADGEATLAAPFERSTSPTTEIESNSATENESTQDEAEQPRKRRKVAAEVKPKVIPLQGKVRPTRTTRTQITAIAQPKTGTAVNASSQPKDSGGKCGYCGTPFASKIDLYKHMTECRAGKPGNVRSVSDSPSKLNWV